MVLQMLESHLLNVMQETLLPIVGKMITLLSDNAGHGPPIWPATEPAAENPTKMVSRTVSLFGIIVVAMTD